MPSPTKRQVTGSVRGVSFVVRISTRAELPILCNWRADCPDSGDARERAGDKQRLKGQCDCQPTEPLLRYKSDLGEKGRESGSRHVAEPAVMVRARRSLRANAAIIFDPEIIVQATHQPASSTTTAFKSRLRNCPGPKCYITSIVTHLSSTTFPLSDPRRSESDRICQTQKPTPFTMDHTRDPCPWVILNDFGGAFAMGVCIPMVLPQCYNQLITPCYRLSVGQYGTASRVSATARMANGGSVPSRRSRCARLSWAVTSAYGAASSAHLTAQSRASGRRRTRGMPSSLASSRAARWRSVVDTSRLGMVR